MVHRKNEHTASVKICRDSKNCQFENCWFVHGNGEEKGVVQNSDMVQRLLSMMEVFSEKIRYIESQM